MPVDPLDPSTWPKRCPDCDGELWRPRQCMGHVDDYDEDGVYLGRRHCGNVARRGQTKCRMHGGSSPNALAAAGRRLAAEGARRALATYGSPIEVDPLNALLGELYRTAGHVAWLGALIADLDHEETGQPRVSGDGDSSSSGRSGLKQYTTDKGLTWEKPSVWVDLYQSERTHLARVAKDCLQVGIEERRVRLAEDQGRLVADVIRRIVTALGLDPAAPEVREVVRRELTVVAGAA